MASGNTNPPCPTPDTSNDDAPMLRTLLIERAGHRWTVRWTPGDERSVMEWAIELVDHQLVGLTSTDARTVAEAVAEALQRYAQHPPVPQGRELND